jgi:hypothetical protein
MVLKGYLDESIDDEWFTFGGLFSTGIKWTWLTTDWINCIDRWNKKLVKENRQLISRYHATDCNGRNKEFKGWSEIERDELVSELQQIITDAEGVHSVSFSVRPSEVAEIFGIRGSKAIKRACYTVLLQYVMLQLGHQLECQGPGLDHIKIMMIHDHTKDYDSALNRAFYQLIEEGFRHKKYFSNILPSDSLTTVPLQSADMLVFELRKQAIRTHNNEPMGDQLKSLIDLPTFGGSAHYFRKDNLCELKQLLDEIKYELGSVRPTPKRKKGSSKSNPVLD